MLGEFIHNSRIYCIKSILDPVTSDEHEIKFKSLKDAQHFFAYVASNPFSREELLEVAKWLRPTSCRPPKNCPKPTEQELLNMLCLMVYKDGLQGDFRLVELKAPGLGMTMADKEKCAEIYEIYTGDIHTEPSKWNERAGDLLAQMVFEIEKCTRGMAAARAVWPTNIKVGWDYLVKVVYHIIKGEVKLRQGYVNTVCLGRGVEHFNTDIIYELEK